MRDLDRWFLKMVLAVAVAVCPMAVGAYAAMPIMGLEGEKKEKEESVSVARPVLDSANEEALKQLLLFVPFRDNSNYKGEWDIYSEVPRGIADSLRGSPFFRTISIDSALVRLKKKERSRGDDGSGRGKRRGFGDRLRQWLQYLPDGRGGARDALQGKIDPKRAMAIGRQLGADYVVMGQIDEMSMKRFRATVPIGGYRSYQGLTTVQLFPYKIIDGEPIGEVVREVVEDSKRYGITNPAAYVPLEKEYFLLGTMEWGSDEFHQTLLGKSVGKCLDVLAVGLDSLIQPPAALKVSEPKVIDIDGSRAYINVGLVDSVQNGYKYGVWDKGRELKDPDSGEVLGKALSRRVGVVQVEQVLSDHLSLVRILEGEDIVEKDFGIRAE